MSVQVFDAELPLSINRFMQLFPEVCAFLPYSRVVDIDVRNENGEHLSAISQLSWGFPCGVKGMQVNVGVPQVHLNTAYRIAIAVVLREAEHSREPGRGLMHVAVVDMGKKNAGGH